MSSNRKTLANGLNNSSELEFSKEAKEEITCAIESLGKGASVRGEALTLQEFAQLSNTLLKVKKVKNVCK